MIIKLIIVVHRYVGVALGVIMTIWCLSGFVMMYQGFPETSQEERLAGLETLDLSHCCASLPIADDAAAGSLRIEMLNGAPVIRIGRRGETQTFNIATGAPIGVLDEAGVRQVATSFAAGNGIKGEIASLDQIHDDQWTVSGAGQQPLWRAEFNDPQNTLVYVDAKAASVVQDANSGERLVAWFGAIPHWLYPAILRTNVALWTQIVIWSSAIGCFLVITGIVVGIARLRGKSGRWFPYKRPMWLFHHIFGTFAGIMVLTWTFSGLLTMHPWGLFESTSPIAQSDISGDMTWADARAVIDHAKTDPALASAIVLRPAPLLGHAYLIARGRHGKETRLGVNGAAPMTLDELAAGLQARGNLLASGKVELQTSEDDFYYGHKQSVDLPVYRVTLTDPGQTRVYINHTTGDARVVDPTSQSYRWFENGLHSLDFSFLRVRPLWDIVTLILLAAVTVACATGAWLSFTRIGTDVSRIKEFFFRRT